MNKRIMMILMATILVLFIAYMNNKYYYREDHLYWEESLQGEQLTTGSQFITRRTAIQKAYDIFRKEYGVDLTSSNIEMYVNLYKDIEDSGSYNWLMSWYDYEKKENYTFTIDAINGEILYLYAGKRGSNVAKSNPESLTYPEITLLIDELAGHLGISMEQFQLEVSYPARAEGQDYWYQKCKLIDSNTGELVAIIELDSTNGMIRGYELKRE